MGPTLAGILRTARTLVVFPLLALGSCSSSSSASRASCTTDAASSTCPSGQSCLWIGAGYFCAQKCSASSPCPTGQSCKSGGASSCMTCQDLVDICD